jgi:hypothetical protein
MPSSAYFLRQADICLRLSLVASDEHVSSRLIAMAQEYKAKAAALDPAAASVAAEITGQDDTSNHQAEHN